MLLEQFGVAGAVGFGVVGIDLHELEAAIFIVIDLDAARLDADDPVDADASLRVGLCLIAAVPLRRARRQDFDDEVRRTLHAGILDLIRVTDNHRIWYEMVLVIQDEVDTVRQSRAALAHQVIGKHPINRPSNNSMAHTRPRRHHDHFAIDEFERRLIFLLYCMIHTITPS